MARYNYKCINDKCTDKDKQVEVTKPMMDSDRKEPCKVCGVDMVRDYAGTSYGIGTGDGFKN